LELSLIIDLVSLDIVFFLITNRLGGNNSLINLFFLNIKKSIDFCYYLKNHLIIGLLILQDIQLVINLIVLSEIVNRVFIVLIKIHEQFILCIQDPILLFNNVLVITIIRLIKAVKRRLNQFLYLGGCRVFDPDIDLMR